MQSHPSWVRGLKLKDLSEKDKEVRSHPSWVRGLKLLQSLIICVLLVSHPSWVRGLKQYKDAYQHLTYRRTPRGCVD